MRRLQLWRGKIIIMTAKRPHLIVIAGPNGAGKSTTAPSLLKGTLKVTEFVNADLIAQGLSGFQPEGAVFHAVRVMLERIHYLAKKGVDFAFETTLASRTFAPWINDLRKTGYDFHLVFLWLPMRILLLPALLSESAWAGTMCRRKPSGGDTILAFATFSDSIAPCQ